MDIAAKCKNRTLTIKIAGEIDHHTSIDLKEKCDKEYINSNAKHIIFDFSDVGFMDSSGIGMIIGRFKNAEKQGGRVVVAHMNAELTRIFNISGLQRIISAYDTVEEAERGLGI